MLTYVLLIIPIVFLPGIVTFAISYSLFLVRLFGVIVRNFGRGDIKALQAIAVALPVYPFLSVMYSLFPPVMAVTLVASVLGLTSSVYFNSKKKKEGMERRFSFISSESGEDKEKFWIEGNRVTYKIPFVTFVAAAYAGLFILSLLLLV